MNITPSHPSPEILKLFDFLDSETPDARTWAREYLRRKSIPITEDLQSMVEISNSLVGYFSNSLLSTDQIKNFSKIMGSAWRVRKSRQKKNAGTLSLTLDKSVLLRLKQMCRGQKKAEILTQLINGGYEKFLETEHKLKQQKVEENRFKKITNEYNQINSQLIRSTTTLEDAKLIQGLQAQNADLRHFIASLYDLIYSANEQSLSIDDAALIEATKIYYNAFSKNTE